MKTALLWDLRSVVACFFTDVSGQPIGPIFRGQTVQEVHATLSKIPQGRRSHSYVLHIQMR